MDRNSLPQLEAENNILQFSRATLLEDYLRTLRDECKAAALFDQPVLLIVLGHGATNHGVAIGGASHMASPPRLAFRHIESALRGLDLNVTLLITSCYSGGWLYRPELNITGAAAAGPTVMSLAHTLSRSGRAHGGLWTTAVTKAFCQFEDERMTQLQPEPSESQIDHEAQSSTWARLSEAIFKTIVSEGPGIMGTEHHVSFAAQDDAWENEWRKRSGIPLMQYSARWLALPLLPYTESASRSNPTGALGLGSLSLDLGEMPPPIYGCKQNLTRRQARAIVIDLCKNYMSSFPGPDNNPSNMQLHGQVKNLLAGVKLNATATYNVQERLNYRMEVMAKATEYAGALSLTFEACHTIDLEAWMNETFADPGKGKGRLKDSDQYNRYERLRSKISTSGTFPPQPLSQMYPYQKPIDYLAAALFSSGMSEVECMAGIAALSQSMFIAAIYYRVQN